MIRVNNKSQEEEPEVIKINPAMKRHFELEIETLQNAYRIVKWTKWDLNPRPQQCQLISI